MSKNKNKTKKPVRKPVTKTPRTTQDTLGTRNTRLGRNTPKTCTPCTQKSKFLATTQSVIDLLTAGKHCGIQSFVHNLKQKVGVWCKNIKDFLAKQQKQHPVFFTIAVCVALVVIGVGVSTIVQYFK